MLALTAIAFILTLSGGYWHELLSRRRQIPVAVVRGR